MVQRARLFTRFKKKTYGNEKQEQGKRKHDNRGDPVLDLGKGAPA